MFGLGGAEGTEGTEKKNSHPVEENTSAVKREDTGVTTSYIKNTNSISKKIQKKAAELPGNVRKLASTVGEKAYKTGKNVIENAIENVIENYKNDLISKFSKTINLNDILESVNNFQKKIAEQIVSKISNERSNDDVFFKDTDRIKFVELYFISKGYEKNDDYPRVTITNLTLFPSTCTIGDLKNDSCTGLDKILTDEPTREDIISDILKYIDHVNENKKEENKVSEEPVDGGGKKRKTRRNKKSKKARKSKRRN